MHHYNSLLGQLSIIRYTAYQDWNVGAAELSYDLQTEAVLGDWKTLKQENSTAEYRDYQFLDATKAGIQLEKCYRVITRLGGSKSTISNILCLPYSPVIFIPTAFCPGFSVSRRGLLPTICNWETDSLYFS